MNLDKKIVLLTGATGGIGQKLALKLAQEGVRLILVGRNEKTLQSLRSNLPNSNGHAFLAADISTTMGRERIIEAVETIDAGVDLYINNAGVNEFKFFSHQSQESIESLLTTNLLSPILLTHSLLPALRKKNTAMIVNVGSSLGSIGFPGYSVYCSSKFGLRGFTESLRRELADSNIQVMYVAPRATQTAINTENAILMNKALGVAMDDPDLVADIIVKSIKQNKPRIYIGWPERFFIWINSIMPKLVDNDLRKKLSTIRTFSHG